MADTVRASPSATQPDAVPGTKVLGPTSSNGGNSASGTGGGASNAGGVGKVRLKGLISRVHASVQVKRKYLVQTAESKQELTATRKKLVAQGVLKVRSRLDVVDVAKAALQEQKQRDASDWAVRYKQFCERFKDSVTESSWFKNAVTIAIFVAGINVGAQTYDLPPGTLSVFETLDDIVLSIFVAECILNIFAEGLQPWRYFWDGWNIFDFLVVVASFLPFGSGQIAILRLMRLLRLLKLVRALPKLRILVIGLLMSFQSIGYVMLMVFLLFYLWAVVGVIFLSKNDPVNFGNLHLAFLALWRSATGDDWTDMMYTAFWGCTSNIYGGGADYGGRVTLCRETNPMGLIFPTFYFIVFQVIASMMLINMFIGAILMSVEEAKDDISNTESLIVKLVKARRLPCVQRNLLLSETDPDPFVRVTLGDHVRKGPVARGTCNPKWNHAVEFQHFTKIKASVVSFEVYHWDRFGRDILLGKVDINTVNVPSNKLVRFQASLEDTSGVEFDGELHVEVRKDVTHAIPEHAFDPDSKLQTIANRMTLARLELHNLKTAIEKRKKHAAEKKKLGLLTRMKSWRSVRSIASQFSFRSGGSGNSGATKSEKDKGSVWKTISRNTLLPATKVTHRVAPPVTHTTGPTRARDVTSGGSSQDMEPRARRPSQPPVVFHAPAETSPRSDGPL